MKPTLLLPALLLLFSGCGVVENMTTVKRTFSVTIRNDSAQPARVGLTKDGPPFEEDWQNAEEMAIHYPRNSDMVWGKLLLPGQTATLGPIDGRFNEGSTGFARIYAGDLTMEQMLSMGRRSEGRMDVGLRPGANRLVLLDELGKMTVKRLPPQQASTEPAAPAR